MPTRRRQAIGLLPVMGGLLALGLATTSSPVRGANSLAVPITSELRQELWPVEIGVEIATADDEERPDAPIEILPLRTVTVPDGHPVSFSSAIWTPRGRLDFEVEVAAHQHPREAMEIEWDLQVDGAAYETVSVGEYLLHRLRFGPRPDVGPQQVRASRADIVTVRGEPHLETVEIDGERYEIRIVALSVRG
ncbi:MAG: hypothetical protein H6712_22220 [Myxococcales bacterium]|nr:hypothetical protein [Myxococcales bacterium]MCB9716591.1 hypothetical protein [Myxococcales bacterium]